MQINLHADFIDYSVFTSTEPTYLTIYFCILFYGQFSKMCNDSNEYVSCRLYSIKYCSVSITFYMICNIWFIFNNKICANIILVHFMNDLSNIYVFFFFAYSNLYLQCRIKLYKSKRLMFAFDLFALMVKLR